MSTDTLSPADTLTADTSPSPKRRRATNDLPEVVVPMAKVISAAVTSMAHNPDPTLARIKDGSLARSEHKSADLRRLAEAVDEVLTLEAVARELATAIRVRTAFIASTAVNFDRGISVRGDRGTAINATILASLTRTGKRELNREATSALAALLK